MKNTFLVLLLSVIYFKTNSQTLQQIEKSRVKLPNGWSITPVGKTLPLGDLPLNIAVSPSQKLMAVTNNGEGVQSIQLVDVKTERQLDAIQVSSAWYGLAFDGENSLYASAGNHNMILQFRITNNKLRLVDSIVLGKKWPNQISPAGIAIDHSKQILYVVTKDNNSLYVVDLKKNKIIQEYKLDAEAYTCLLSPKGDELYISCWGGDKLLTFNTNTYSWNTSIPLGDNPNEMILSKTGQTLYVCNANDNSVSVVDLQKKAVIETLNTALFPSSPSGSTPNGLALSADEKTLYIANADNNCLAVFDVSAPANSRSKGFIPTGWYPTNVKVLNKKIWVSNGKGYRSLPNTKGPNPYKDRQKVNYQMADVDLALEVQYIGRLFMGKMSIIAEPSEKQLSIYSKVVYNNTPYNKQKEAVAEGVKNNPIPTKKGQASPIKHVFYIIKENRTYDQVLGDMKEGNGDPSLVLFGEKVTPNLHALAKQFVLLDNFYVDAEVSADGHNWSMGGYATDFLEKTWPTSYGGRGGSYSGEGDRVIANNKDGFIWDNCARQGVSFRTYGEFADSSDNTIPVLKNHACPYYTGFNMGVKDTTRFNQWKRDFDSLLAIGKVPALNTIRFSNDHTEGIRKGRPTPFAHMADNDLAVGMFIEYLSQTPLWNESAVFILEDDAQNGADHVDAHRSPAYLAGGFVKRNQVDHTMYSTTSVLRTIELILGLPPMTQYDAAATPMWRCFDNKATPSLFKTIAPNYDINERSTVENEWQRRSEKFNLAKEDAIPDLEFNTVLWHAIKGDAIPFPGVKRAAFVRVVERDKVDD